MSQTDQEFLTAFLEARLSPADFNHEAHVRAAWLVLHRYPFEPAVAVICAGILRLATQFGAPDRYNRTASESWMRLVASRFDRTLCWTAWRQANADLLHSSSQLLSPHYSHERLHSIEAKHQFIPPDRLPLPSCDLQKNSR